MDHSVGVLGPANMALISPKLLLDTINQHPAVGRALQWAGLSTVHVNRVLQQLRGCGLIRVASKRLVTLDRYGLAAVAYFKPEKRELSQAA